MKGDFSRDTFDPFHHFSRILMQQGRVQLDADWNEQVSVLLHYLRALAKDMNGPFWGPAFVISKSSNGDDLDISKGNYYVDGILCENEGEFRNKDGVQVKTSYKNQPDYAPDKPLPPPSAASPHLIYLDVWERHLTYLETTVEPFTLSTPNIREIALGGADTTTRARVVWQVKVESLKDNMKTGFLGSNSPWKDTDKTGFNNTWTNWLNARQPPKGRGMLKARAKQDSAPDKEPCLAPPESSYRGLENQLYRVEIHNGGTAWSDQNQGQANDLGSTATFKWSRDNGSIIFPVLGIADRTFTLEHLGRDVTSFLKEGHWLELIDDDMVKRNEPGKLAKVAGIDPDLMTVTLELPEGVTLPTHSGADCVVKHVLLRRWDHKISVSPSTNTTEKPTSHEGALLVIEGDEPWISLEDGVQICFQPAPTATPATPHTYRAGDYWLIPARVATQDVEWPKDGDKPWALPPHGVEHHYAPLAIIIGTNAADVKAPWHTYTA